MANEMTGKPVCGQERMTLHDSLELVGGKWKLLIVNTAKMLSKELKELEQNLLVTREVHATKPVTVTMR